MRALPPPIACSTVQQVETGSPGDFATMSDEELDVAIAESLAIINGYQRAGGDA
jgi:hypothetical protein